MIRIGIPAYDEQVWLPRTLAALAAQDDLDFQVWVHVNQPPRSIDDPNHQRITAANQATLDDLSRADYPFELRVMDGVNDKRPAEQAGVGWARRLLFEKMLMDWDGVVISLDADTTMDRGYVAAVRRAFREQPAAVGLVAPYYHHLPEDEAQALHLLRYEIYLRYYQLNLRRIGSPYAFLALGSALAFRSRAYRAIGGMPPREAGEDFYFLQKLRKYGPLIMALDAMVYPSSRRSQRVPFGTGPLMGESDLELQERRFPFYGLDAFDLLGKTFKQFETFYTESVTFAIDDFIRERRRGYAGFERMRRNFKRPEQFVHACHERFDALRTLQYLRFHQERNPEAAGVHNVVGLLARYGLVSPPPVFRVDRIGELDGIRDLLVKAMTIPLLEEGSQTS